VEDLALDGYAGNALVPARLLIALFQRVAGVPPNTRLLTSPGQNPRNV
jgi:hypothetical protein